MTATSRGDECGPIKPNNPRGRAHKRAKSYTSLLWHIGVFIVINGFFWILDLTTGGDGNQWAYWLTIFWVLALAHIVAYLVGDSGIEQRKYQQALAEEKQRQRDDT